MKTSTIILAGGNGTRFWPKSRTNLPKQFLNLSGNDTLLNETIRRLDGISPTDTIYIVGNESHKSLFDQYLPKDFLIENLMLEPLAKNTAPAIGASVMALHKSHGNHVIVVLPSDQHMKQEIVFKNQLKKAIQLAASSHKVVTLGIKPTYAATGYGYLNTQKISTDVHALTNFVEKPDLHNAKKYIRDPHYFWNAGIFVFESSVMLKHIKVQMPELYALCCAIEDWKTDYDSGKLLSLYQKMPSESIDYGVMEKIDDMLMVPLDCGWSDLGSWDALENVINEDVNQNILEGDVLTIDTIRTTIIGNGKPIAAIGLHDLVIVDTEDALLICRKEDVQKIKQIVSTLQQQGRTHLI